MHVLCMECVRMPTACVSTPVGMRAHIECSLSSCTHLVRLQQLACAISAVATHMRKSSSLVTALIHLNRSRV